MNRVKNMNQSSSFIRTRQFIVSLFLFAVVFVSGADLSRAQDGKGQPPPSVHSVVAKQAALVSEFEINGLKVLMKRREGSLTVAAGLFIRGGSANINVQNAG